jgi:predicted amidohydrolase YtcJ
MKMISNYLVNTISFHLFNLHTQRSDMYWADDRLGPDRVKGAYAFKQLLEQNGWIPLGTDFPVEDISPFKTFYAAVVRKDARDGPPAVFNGKCIDKRRSTTWHDHLGGKSEL